MCSSVCVCVCVCVCADTAALSYCACAYLHAGVEKAWCDEPERATVVASLSFQLSHGISRRLAVLVVTAQVILFDVWHCRPVLALPSLVPRPFVKYKRTRQRMRVCREYGPGLECEKRCWYAIIDHWPGALVMEER